MVPVSASIPAEADSFLVREAEKQKRSKAAIIRFALEEFVARKRRAA